MKKKTSKDAPPVEKDQEKIDKDLKLTYPPNQDIYNNALEEEDIDPDDLSRRKAPNEKRETGNNEKDFEDDISGNDLDVPGSELDDAAERNGEEDEENNNYSIGGDNHNDLEEDQGD